MSVKEFYEKMYGDDKTSPAKRSLYSSILDSLLRRFGIDRYRLTYQFLPGGDFILDIGIKK